MQIRINEKRVHKVVNETVNGLNVIVDLTASANNTQIADTQYMTATGFDASGVSIDVHLKRNGRIFTMISTNLAVLAHFNSLTMNAHQFYKGTTRVKRGASVKQEQVRSLFIPFYGHHNIKGSDELIVTVHVANNTFNTGVDSIQSSILVTPNQSIGVESAIYSFHTHAIQANQETENVNLGDNVQRLALISFDRDGMKQIFRQASLSSDRLDWTYIDSELRLKHYQYFPYNYADALISNSLVEDQLRYFPNSFLIHDKDEIDGAKLKVNTNPVNVASSTNYIAWISFETSQEILQRAIQMEQKHATENVSKIPETITP